MAAMIRSATGTALLVGAVRARSPLVVPALMLMCLWQVCEALVPVLIGVIIDRAVIPRDLTWLVLGVGALLLVFTVLALGYRFGARLANKALNHQTHDLRVEVAGHALNPRGVRTSLLPGEVLSVATSDADVSGLVFRQIALAGAAMVGVVVGSVYLLLTDWVVGVVVLVSLVLVLGAIQFLTPLIDARTTAQQAKIAAASGQATDLMQGLRVLKGIGGEEAAGARYRRASGEARDATVATMGGLAIAQAIQMALLAVLVAGVVGVAGVRLIDGHLSVGQLIGVVGVATFLAEPIGLMVQMIVMSARSRAAAQRIVDFGHAEPLIATGSAETDPTSPVLAVHGHPLVGGPAVTGDAATVDLALTAGELVVVVAAAPGQAESLLDALAGEREDAGEVLLGGVPRASLALAAAHRHLVVVPHHVDVFEGTIGSNITLRAAPDVELSEILAAAAVDELLGLFPEGIEHPVDASGTNLSGGQRQRIALARALATDAPVLVLHDPTTSVDAVTEQSIASGVRRLRHTDGGPPRATVVVTSSPAFLAAADRVVHLGESDPSPDADAAGDSLEEAQP